MCFPVPAGILTESFDGNTTHVFPNSFYEQQAILMFLAKRYQLTAAGLINCIHTAIYLSQMPSEMICDIPGPDLYQFTTYLSLIMVYGNVGHLC